MHWHTPGFETLELSTQLVVKEALRRGHAVDVLDAASCFIRIRGNGRIEYLRQATRTSADSYVSPLIMENKKVTKLLLHEAGLRVPDGRDYRDLAALRADYAFWRGRDTVVKPNATNFGVAVALLPAPIAEGDYVAAAEAALAEDDTVLVEEMLHGQEYRLLVIGDAVRATLKRVPARVIGDGQSSIATLVHRKNDDPLRGKGYRSPLERLRLGAEEAAHLRAQGLSFDSVPPAGSEVFLRRNSNISTGGDSIDVTAAMHPGYRDLALAAAAAVGARICGVDMIVRDLVTGPTAGNYGVIELNFNPALHIHDFPFQGDNRQVEAHVLDLLGL
jgi:D-alanine-D-alanine ligase-like ATP-grasp enzyme